MLTLNIKIDYIIYAAIIFIALAAFITYAIISNHINKKILVSKPHKIRKQEYLLEINVNLNTISVFKNMGQDCIFTYSINDAYSLLGFKDIKRFETWYNHILNDEKTQNHETLSITVMNPLDSKMHLMRLFLITYNRGKQKVYIKLIEVINNPRLYFNEKSFKMLDLLNFSEKIKSITNANLGVRGLLIILRLEGLENMRKRYGVDLSNTFLMEIWRSLNKIASNQVFVTYLNSSQFGIFKSDILEMKDAKVYLEELLSNLAQLNISLDQYSINPTFTAGITLFGEYTYDLKIAIKNAIQALEKPNFRAGYMRYGIYDYSLEKENILFAQESEQLANIINNNDIITVFEPYIYLQQTSLIGYYAVPSKSLLNNSSFLANLKMASSIGMKNEYLRMVYTQVLNFCYVNSKKRYRLYIDINIELLELFKSIIENNYNFSKLRIFLVLNYQELLNVKVENFDNLISELRELNVCLTTYSDISMLTYTSKYLEKIDAIIFTAEMIKGIENDDLKYMTIVNIIDSMNNMNMRYMANGVTKYEQAELLQKTGVNVISGSFITPPLNDLNNIDFLKNRHIQTLNNRE